jgi:cell wall-associated NlpC family hydrolase
MNNLRSSSIKMGDKLIVAVNTVTVARSSQSSTARSPRIARDLSYLEQEEYDDEEIPPITEEEWLEIEQGKGANTSYLGQWKNAKERQLLAKVAMGFIGAPYRSGGDTVRGLDSPGFVQKIYEIFDVPLPRDILGQSRLGMKIDLPNLREGDVLFFHSPFTVGIVGIYVGNNRFVHASPDGNREVRTSNLNDPNLSKHFIKAVRLKYLEGEV